MCNACTAMLEFLPYFLSLCGVLLPLYSPGLTRSSSLNWTALTQTLSPPQTINKHDAGSLFSWWICYWLYGLLLHLEGPDMDGFPPLEGLCCWRWIDSYIDNSLRVSVGVCFMHVGRCWGEAGGEGLARESQLGLGDNHQSALANEQGSLIPFFLPLK